MIRLLSVELYKIFKRPRTYISFGIVTAIAAVIQLAMTAGGRDFVSFGMQGITDQFDVQGHILNGYLVAYFILQSLLIHIPLLVALVAGDALAGEANIGTLRLVLTRPVGRTELVLVKFIASCIYSIALITWLALVALFLSLAFFGTGDMVNMKSDTVIILLNGDIMWRYLAAFCFAALAMTTIVSLSMFLSAFTDNAIGPIISTMGIVIVLTVLTNLELPLFQMIKPYLFTTHMIGWKGFFDNPVHWDAITNSVIVLVVYTIVLLWLTIFYFNRKDIKT